MSAVSAMNHGCMRLMTVFGIMMCPKERGVTSYAHCTVAGDIRHSCGETTAISDSGMAARIDHS